MLEVSGLTRSQRAKQLLSDISFSLPAGETLGVLGPSGSGKSTLLRAILGLDPIQAGTISWHGRKLSSADKIIVPTEKRGFGMVFQDGALFPHLSVVGNVAFGLNGLSAERKAATVTDWIDRCKIKPIRYRRVHTISGGECQRTALARALAPQPQLLLLDEPFNSVDRGVRFDLLQTLKQYVADTGATIVLVTHDSRDVVDFCTRVLLLFDGKVNNFGETASVLRTPKDDTAKEYLSHGMGPIDGDVP